MFIIRAMRFAASPLMVAVALGLLGPSVLEAEEEGLEDRASSESSEEREALPAHADEASAR